MPQDSDTKSDPQASDQSHYDLPDIKVLEQAGELEIQDKDGKKIKFKSLYAEQGKKHVIVFVRHFFCGHCEDYVRALTSHLTPTTLSSLSPPADLTIIGCGDTSTIPGYHQRTNTSFPIYTDPNRALYTLLGMTRSLDLGPTKPDYVQSGIVAGTLKSMGNMIKAGTGGLKGGDYSQNGGEWVWDEQGKLEWCRRMRNTRDHAEVREVEGVLGVKRKG